MNKLLPLAVAALAAAAPAETLKTVPATLDPAKAYILIEYHLTPNTMAGFPGSRKYVPLSAGLILARYDPVLGDVRGMGKAVANPVPRGSVVEPFRNREIARTDGSRLMLVKVDPDVWVVQGYGTTSFSLGSYTFALDPGSVTDLGVVTAEADWADGDRAPTTGDVFKGALLGPFAKRAKIAPARVSFRPRTAADLPVPAILAAAPVRPVHFKPGATFGNYLGGLVNRIEGVNAAGVKPGTP